MRRSMTRVKEFTFPIKKGVLSLINEKFEGKKVLHYKGNNLKKEYVIYLIYYIVKETDEEVNAVDLSSKILRKNFIDKYKPYLSYLEDIGLIFLASQYLVGSHPNMYGVTNDYYRLEKGYIKFKINDVILLKKVNSGNKQYNKVQLSKKRYCEKVRYAFSKIFQL